MIDSCSHFWDEAKVLEEQVEPLREKANEKLKIVDRPLIGEEGSGSEVAASGSEVAASDSEVAVSGSEVAASGSEVAASGSEVAASDSEDVIDPKVEAVKIEADALTNAMNTETKRQ